jgi:type I restriction enzyme S subunit
MNAQDLKNSILQRAIEGKLVPQRKEEGTAKELLAEIRAEKARLIKEKKIKKSKSLPEITDEEKPFDIPESWEWVRLMDLCANIVDCPHSTPKYFSNNTGYYAIDTNVIDSNGEITGWRYVSQESYLQRISRLTPEQGDIVLTREGSIGRAAILPSDKKICLGQRVMLLRPSSYTNINFIKIILMAPNTLTRLTEKQKGLGAKHINVSDVCKIILPLPPLAEQHRIVAKIEEFQPDIDAYDKAQTKLQAIEQRFPDDMKKSLLQYAIEGKLVPQRKEEGTAKDLLAEIRAEKARLVKEKKIKKSKPLPAITNDEKPFDIPDSWEWVRLGDIIELQSGQDFSPSKYSDTDKDGTPYITGASSFTENGVLENRWTKCPKCIATKGDILLVCKGSGYGKVTICNLEEVHIARQIMAIKQRAYLSIAYIKFFLMARIKLIKKNGQGVIPGISRDIVLNLLFPLPPLAEQHRIVAKLEELLPLCQQLASHP